MACAGVSQKGTIGCELAPLFMIDEKHFSGGGGGGVAWMKAPTFIKTEYLSSLAISFLVDPSRQRDHFMFNLLIFKIRPQHS